MRILQAPVNIASGAGLLAKTLRDMGYYAHSYSHQYPGPMTHNIDILNRNPDSSLNRLKQALTLGYKYDVFQFWFGLSLAGLNLADVPILKRLGKKVFFYFNGCDIRDEKLTISKYKFSACANCFPKLCSPNRETSLAVARDYGDGVFVSTPDLLEMVPNSKMILQPVNYDVIDSLDEETTHPPTGEQLVITHAPTNRSTKGTEFIIKAVDNLKKRGMKIDLRLIENMPPQSALKQYAGSHLAIDQMLFGSYGTVTAEMMALGVPVMVYVREDLIDLYPEPPPLINASLDTLETNLIKLYENRDLLHELVEHGKAYAKRHHHPTVIATQFLECYLN